MKKYDKLIVGIDKNDIQCYAKKWDILVLAGSNDKMKGRLPKEHHFFVSVVDRKPSRYGVIKKIPNPLTALDLAKLDYQSRGENIVTISNEILMEYEDYLEKISRFEINTPIATTWLIKKLSQEKVLRIHKILFTNFSDGAKKEYFGF
ncbi:hypothetical protein AN960_09320 [Bacillus sp. FJAT-25509]|uniref:hypothetical protein n=1 Tax=Bacillus sp. FJAT-25509 TaxID=1712029 RepID=UPI0006F61E6A|nr:hypothetical protein [Bacillus sp. FJAT-25509]KQL39172.1 hypothetical protein AN960_09320 [Bacillus sp. FJAT-25509]